MSHTALERFLKSIETGLKTNDFAPLIAQVPYAAYLGLQIHQNNDCRQYQLPYQPKLIGNPTMPALHGGVIAGFLENAALFEVVISQHQRIPRTIDFSIDYMRSAKPEHCYARVDIQRAGRRVVLAHMSCWQQVVDKPVATARAHFLLHTQGLTAD